MFLIANFGETLTTGASRVETTFNDMNERWNLLNYKVLFAINVFWYQQTFIPIMPEFMNSKGGEFLLPSLKSYKISLEA